MKMFTLLLCLLFPAVFTAGVTNATDRTSGIEVEKAGCGNCLVVLYDDITMDKLYTTIRCELIYSGSENNKVYFRHNEYLCDENGFVRKAGYSRNLEYDIEKSNIIDYKGLKIEVVSANSKELKFRILPGSENSKLALTK